MKGSFEDFCELFLKGRGKSSPQDWIMEVHLKLKTQFSNVDAVAEHFNGNCLVL
jgi:hypothetical protein